MVPPSWVEMILIWEKRFLVPVATMLVIMRVVSNMNSITEAFSPLSGISLGFVIVEWTKREDTIQTLKHATRLRRSHVHGCGGPKKGRRCVPAVIAG